VVIPCCILRWLDGFPSQDVEIRQPEDRVSKSPPGKPRRALRCSSQKSDLTNRSPRLAELDDADWRPRTAPDRPPAPRMRWLPRRPVRCRPRRRVDCDSRQPLLDGARRRLERGFDPEALLTMRMHDRPYDTLDPKPIREWAKLTIAERDRRGLQRERRLDQTMPRHDIWAHQQTMRAWPGADSPKASAPFLDPASDGRSGMSTMALATSCGHSVTASNAGKKHRQWRHDPLQIDRSSPYIK
jgi:hypothetical protein